MFVQITELKTWAENMENVETQSGVGVHLFAPLSQATIRYQAVMDHWEIM